jgi:hypothetical protein
MGLCGGKQEAAAVAIETVRFAGMLKLVAAGETVQLAAEGAPVQAKATF